MNPIAAVIAIGIISALAIVMLGTVQTARTRAMTRKRLDEAIPDTPPTHALGTLTHQSPSDRVRRANEGLDGKLVREAAEDARAMEEGS